MKILNERDSFVANYEVRAHLEELKNKHNWTFNADEDKDEAKRYKKRLTAGGLELEAVTRDVLAYLGPATPDTGARFDTLVRFLNQYDLVKVEKLQIINALPRSMVHLYALVEECDQRLDEEACEAVLAKVAELFPENDDEEEEEEADQEQHELEQDQ